MPSTVIPIQDNNLQSSKLTQNSKLNSTIFFILNHFKL